MTKSPEGILRGSTTINAPLLNHVALSPEDLKGLSLNLRIQRQGKHLEVVAEGEGLNGTSEKLDVQGNLQMITLNAGDRLVLTAFKKDWHWNGGARFEELTIRRISGNEQTQPLKVAEALISGSDQLAMMGFGDFGKFPTLKKEENLAVIKAKPSWKLDGTSISVKVDENSLF